VVVRCQCLFFPSVNPYRLVADEKRRLLFGNGLCADRPYIYDLLAS